MKQLILSVVLLLAIWAAPVAACDGHYEVRYETVVVVPAYYEHRFVYAPVFNCGRCLRQGYYVTVVVPAQYATRAVQVFVADPPRVYARPYTVYDGEDVGGSSWYLTVRGLFGRR